MEAQRPKRHELQACALGLAVADAEEAVGAAIEVPSLRRLVDRYLDQIKTLKKPNTYRKYDAVLFPVREVL
jgi:hypothetical protein